MSTKINFLFSLGLGLFCACKSSKLSTKNGVNFPAFDVEAHRGGRGLYPENTIIAMKNAVDLGVNTLEMDTHITKDSEVVVTHDDYLNADFILNKDGTFFSKAEGKEKLIYQINYQELKSYDVGSKFYSSFPQQQKVKAYIPRLADLIDSVQNYLQTNKKPQVFYNIETKCSPKGDGVLHPNPDEFVTRLISVIKDKGITPFVIIQSFDKRTLQIIHQKHPEIKTAFLVAQKNTYEAYISDLGFKPFILSPAYKIVDEELVQKCHQNNIKIIPWTVNTLEEIKQMKSLGVDGIITDYPNLLTTK
ncbi:glycerophosphodiester phosphodiesterase family protein [Pedobacter alpinus]|uniref:Glycerophosphodiester phosphodiesterase family protein n=1 Tax=Pedobacter alpinus TaxID=1590643 RepID=A0ABW5TSC5_9SPHI